jgi:hypothetical protein
LPPQLFPLALKYFRLDLDTQLHENFGPLLGVLSWLASLPWWLTAGVLAVGAVAAWLWRRPREVVFWNVELAATAPGGPPLPA